MNNDSRLFAAAVNLSRQKGEIRYELADSEVLELYYTEPRLAALIEMDVIRLIDRHLVVNLKKFITPKTHHLSAHAKRNKPACCVGIQYVPDVQYAEDGENIISCTLDILLQAAGFLEKGEAETGTQSARVIQRNCWRRNRGLASVLSNNTGRKKKKRKR